MRTYTKSTEVGYTGFLRLLPSANNFHLLQAESAAAALRKLLPSPAG